MTGCIHKSKFNGNYKFVGQQIEIHKNLHTTRSHINIFNQIIKHATVICINLVPKLFSLLI